ncbi:MAG: SDR family NAD(P)-dependent oxidoreductase [Woeseiaceae bacterium]|nr:SDR family NAD(P)-dependent oxidoreductase [Woeseiaceae bacterium]
MLSDFEDKTVIITGGSRGVGAACARRFAAGGANIVLVARTRKYLDRIAEELHGEAKVTTVAMDVADPDACINMLKKARFEYEGVHLLVNNAGFHARGRLVDNEAEDLGRMVDVNLRAPIMLTRLAIPFIKESGGGAIINVASLAGCVPVPDAATYSATKFGLRAFSFALAEELEGSGIKVAVVSPGPIDTGFIMDDIDKVSDLTFSQPMSTADQVAEEIVRLCGNRRREKAMPASSGWLAAIGYLFPALRRALLPFFRKKGQRVKRQLKAEKRAARASDAKE